MTDENTIQISAEVHASNHAALAGFFENRSLIASQRYLDAATNLARVNVENEELRAAITKMSQPKPGDDDDSALAGLLRAFVADDIRTPSATDSLVRDALRIIDVAAYDGGGAE